MTLLALAVSGRGVVDPDEPVLHADDLALLRGQAAFETLRVYGGRPFRLDAHLARLAASAERIGLPAVEADGLAELAAEALAASNARRLRPARVLDGRTRDDRRAERARPRQPAAGRPRCAADPRHPVDLAPARARRGHAHRIALAARRRQVDELRDQHGRRDRGTPSRRRRRRLPLARRRRARGPGDERLVAGRRALCRHPPSSSGFSPASRGPRCCRSRAGSATGSRRAATSSSAWPSADEAFTSSSVREIMPVVELDGRPVGAGRPGPASAAVQEAIRAAASGHG